MDIDKVFELFEEPKGNNRFIPLEDYSKIMEDYKKHPLYWVGMFKKLIQNHFVFNSQLMKFFDNLDKGLDKIDVDRAGEFIIFNRGWSYIEHINVKDLIHQEAIYRFADIHLKTALELSINYYQETEEFEKCSHLKKILDFVKLLLT